MTKGILCPFFDNSTRIADEVTVMRDGKVVHNAPIEQLDHDTLIAHMVGRKMENIYPKEVIPILDGGLELKNCSGGKFEHVSLQVKRGEIVGLAGLMGAGRTELARAVFGMDELTEGEVLIDNDDGTVTARTDVPLPASEVLPVPLGIKAVEDSE